ncbi:MAG: 5-(carboxyamino)imidazole ribonucleotide synthase, partial [Phycisphaerales bacterium JB041]
MRVGVLGGGQLGRMLAIAGHRIGARVRCLDPHVDACAGQLTELVVG